MFGRKKIKKIGDLAAHGVNLVGPKSNRGGRGVGGLFLETKFQFAFVCFFFFHLFGRLVKRTTPILFRTRIKVKDILGAIRLVAPFRWPPAEKY